MKRLSLVILVLIAFVQCKKDSPIPLGKIQPIVGEWRITACKDTDGKTTVPDTSMKGKSLITVIRPDGVIVDGFGRMSCCPASKYFFNDREFIPRPTAPVEPSLCPFVLCGACPELRITMPAPDILHVQNCGGGTSILVREK